MTRWQTTAPRPPAPRGPRLPRWLAVAAGAAAGVLGFVAWARWDDGDAPARAVARRSTTPSRRPARLGDDAPSRSVVPDPAPLGPSDVVELVPEDLEPYGGVGPAPRELDGPEREVSEDEPEPHPSGESTPSVSGAAPQALPPGHPDIAESVEPPSEPSESPEPRERRVEHTTLTRWRQPGLCGASEGASQARQLMMQRFRRLDWEEGSLYLDPRLSNDAQEPLVEALEAAERDVQAQLRLTPSRPDVFAYRDKQLLLAAACTNDDVAAYYDGALHVVATDADVATSVVHEYTHHALISAGIVGPAWAQEGIAMTVARETWWKQRRWLDRVAEQPFSLEAMESTVPYTLRSDQALLFYVQAGAMVACALRDEPGGLAALVRAFAEGSDGTGLEYSLPPLAEPRSLRACANVLLE